MRLIRRIRSAASAMRFAGRTPPWIGICPICQKNSIFLAMGAWLREDLKCVRCKSSSRQRAVVDYIARTFPALGKMHIYEPSPTQPSTDYLRRYSAQHTWSYYPATSHSGHADDSLNQDLQSLSYDDNSFDLVVSQDVFEHIADPRKAFSELARVLKPGGSHVFTIPWYPGRRTERRAKMVDNETVHLQSPEYHSDPYDDNGALVFTRFGSDIDRIIEESSGMRTSIIEAYDSRKGIYGDSLYIFHSMNSTESDNQ